MKVLSLFDGISCARVALERAGIPVELYYASEIDKYAIQISEKNWSDIIHFYDVRSIATNWKEIEVLYKDLDLLIGGSPCQDLSIAKKNRKGLDGERSGLFWEYVRILREVKPKYFILENVASMSKEAKDIITKELGVEPIMINATLVSAQNRKRLFWTNIPNVTQPEDRGILLKDILECGTDTNTLITFRHRIKEPVRITNTGKSPTILSAWGTGGNNVPYVDRNKTYCLDANYFKGTSEKHYKEKGVRQIVYQGREIRKLTPIECERLQGLPDNYTEGVSNTQRYKALGNAFNVDVVAHILSFIK